MKELKQFTDTYVSTANHHKAKIDLYPIGWEWLHKVPLKDFNWLIDVFATATDNTDVYFFIERDLNNGHVISLQKPYLARFLNDDLGYFQGVNLNCQYLVAKLKGWTSESEFMEHFTEIQELSLTN